MSLREAFSQLFGYDKYHPSSEQQELKMQKHWDRTGQLVDELNPSIKAMLDKDLKVLVIGEHWCGDCVNTMPVIARIAEAFPSWQLRIANRDSYEKEVGEYYLTGGRRKIPVVVFADQDGDEICRWVERPTRSYHLLAGLQAKRLPKEEYISAYRSMPELQPPSLTKEIFRELLECATRTLSIIAISPSRKL